VGCLQAASHHVCSCPGGTCKGPIIGCAEALLQGFPTATPLVVAVALSVASGKAM